MSDVQVTVGADATPFQRTMAQVQAQAKKTGDVLGVELGSRTGYRDELRMETGLHRLVNGLSAAKTPAEGFSAVVDGLGQSFRITGAAMIGFAIGDFISQQITKAGEAAIDFQQKFSDAMSVNISSSSAAQLTDLEKKLKEMEEQYGKRGLLEKWLYGKDEDAQMEESSARLEVVKKAASAARARLTRDETATLTSDLRAKAAAEIDQVKDLYKDKLTSASAAGAERDELVAIEEQKAAKIKQINEKLNLDLLDQRKKLITYGEDRVKSEDSAELEGAKARAKITAAADLDAANPRQKEELLKNRILGDRAAIEDADTTAERQAAITQQLQDQVDLQKQQRADALEKVGLLTQQKDLQAALAEDQSSIGEKLSDALGFHGQVDSMRRLGFAGRAGPNQNHDALKALQDIGKRIDKGTAELTALNKKLDAI